MMFAMQRVCNKLMTCPTIYRARWLPGSGFHRQRVSMMGTNNKSIAATKKKALERLSLFDSVIGLFSQENIKTYSFLSGLSFKLVVFCYNLYIHSGYFYSASSSSLLLRGAPDTARIYATVSEFHAEAHRRMRVKDLPKVPTWWLERDSNLGPFARKATILPMSHHASALQ